MAKIKAYGERELRRWTVGSRVLVLTQKADGRPGRLLSKYADLPGAGYTVLMPGCTLERAERYIVGLNNRKGLVSEKLREPIVPEEALS